MRNLDRSYHGRERFESPVTLASRQTGRCFLCLGVLAFFFSMASVLQAGKVVLKIQAGNPIDQPQTVQIKSMLPPRVRTNDVINLNGLDLGYDVKSDVYYVHKELELPPKGIVVFNVEINDIWVIPEGDLKRLQERADELVRKLDGSEYFEEAGGLKTEIQEAVSKMAAVQGEYALKPGVSPMAHIRAYEANRVSLGRVRKDIGHLENLVLGTGQDPGELLGDVKEAPRASREQELAPGEYKTAVIRVTVRNTSPTETRRVEIRHGLPTEIQPSDILDPAGLEVVTDFQKGSSYLYKKDVEVAPSATLNFDVKIRDKWNINAPRIPFLTNAIAVLQGRITEKDKYQSVVDLMDGLLVELAGIEQEKGPTELNSAYVAFYRDQSARLDAIEQKISRVESAMRPMDNTSKFGFKVKAPSMKTTWLLIYIILGFLALMSLLFFLRWYGKAKDEATGENVTPSETGAKP